MNNDSGKKIALLSTIVSSFLTPFMASSINIALPSIGKEFSMDAGLLGWVATSYLLSSAIFLIPLGKIADIYGRKKVFMYGIIVYAISSFLLSISSSSAMLLSFRAIQGVGASMIFGTRMAILTSVFPSSERGKVLGINVAAIYTGLSGGPLIGGFLTQHFGWRSIFLITVPICIAIILLITLKLKNEWTSAQNEKFDFIGSIIYGLGIVSTIYGFSLIPSLTSVLFITTGLTGLLLFVIFERKVENPIVNFNLFANNTAFIFSNLTTFINYIATASVSLLMSFYLQFVKGFTPQSAGLILIFQAIIQASISPFAGRLSDKIEPRIVASSGMGLMLIALLIFSTLGESTPIAVVVMGLILLGAGFAFFSSPNTNAVMSSVDKKFYGVASATNSTMVLMGNMISIGIATLILTMFIGKVKITPEHHIALIKSIRIIFSLSTIICSIGIFSSLSRGNVRTLKVVTSNQQAN